MAKQEKAVVIGISGPSSSGKTTLARLLQRIFYGTKIAASERLNTFIIHEDDFYFADDKYVGTHHAISHSTDNPRIPYTTTRSGETIQDWDTAAAIDLPFLTQALHYVRQNGTLPPRLRSKEDQNDASESGVPDEVVDELKNVVESRLHGTGKNPTIAFLEGFLLFAPPTDANHVLRPVHDAINLHLFLPAAYGNVKERREGRSGYVTVGPAPAPVETELHQGVPGKNPGEIDLEAEDDRPPQNFWVDPPGYVDDVVWPRYVGDHAWLLIADEDEKDGGKSGSLDADEADLVRRVGDGTRVRTNVGVEIAPGAGGAGMDVVLRWAVRLILDYYLEQI
jgi:nicotinamide/nicotinate riboside kinase